MCLYSANIKKVFFKSDLYLKMPIIKYIKINKTEF